MIVTPTLMVGSAINANQAIGISQIVNHVNVMVTLQRVIHVLENAQIVKITQMDSIVIGKNAFTQNLIIKL